MQSFSRSFTDWNQNVKFDPTLIGVAATKFTVKYVIWLLFSVTWRRLEEMRQRRIAH